MWVWVNSGRWCWTGRPAVLQFMQSQSQTRLSIWTELIVLHNMEYHLAIINNNIGSNLNEFQGHYAEWKISQKVTCHITQFMQHSFFKKCIYFIWRLVTLQYCSDFCQTLTWISHVCTSVPHTSPPLFQYIPQVVPKRPVSCIKLGLAIYFTYGNIRVSMLFSQIIPPSPSPTESKSLFLLLCLFCCLAYRVIVTIFLNSIYMC